MVCEDFTKGLIFVIALLVVTLIFCNLARFFRPGPLMICAQSFSSGSFLALALLSYLPDTFSSTNTYIQPYNLYTALATFVFFSIVEHFPSSSSRHSLQDSMNSEGSTRDFSHFLIHHFSTVPSKLHFWFTFLFLLTNAVLMGFSIHKCQNLSLSNYITFPVAKMVESFTLGLLLQSYQAKLLIFWCTIVLYSIASPITFIILSQLKFDKIDDCTYFLTSMSVGLFLYIGILLWRATFLLPFDWRRSELLIVCASFAAAILIQALAIIGSQNKNSVTN